MKHQESLKATCIISHSPDSIQSDLNLLLANGVVTPGIVVGSVLLPCYQLLRVEQLPVGSNSDLINYSWLQINKDSPWYMLAY